MALDVLKGLTPVRKLGSNYNSGGFNTYPIVNGLAENIGEGDPVKLSGGTLSLAVNTDPCIGVFQSVRFIDSNGLLQIKPNFESGTSSKGGIIVEGGYTQPLANVHDDPNQTFLIRTDDATTVSIGNLGQSFAVSAIGSVVGKRSQAVLDVTSVSGAQDGSIVTIIGKYTGRDSEFGDTPIAVEVKLSNYGIVGEF